MTSGRADPQVVRRHVAALREALANLQRHSARTAADMAGNADLRWVIERGFELCAQNVLDVATHISASSGVDAPDYASAIDRLAELGVLPADFAARLRTIAGFRNVLVHGYLKIDLGVLENALREKLPQLEQFAELIETHLAKTAD